MEWIIGVLALKWLLPDPELDDEQVNGWMTVFAFMLVPVLAAVACPVLAWIAVRDWRRSRAQATGAALVTADAVILMGFLVNWVAAGGLAVVLGMVYLILIGRAAVWRKKLDEKAAFAEDDYYYRQTS